MIIGRNLRLICNDCGESFFEDECVDVRESRGEFWGMPCYETMGGCPHCKSTDLVEDEEYDYGDEDDE